MFNSWDVDLSVGPVVELFVLSPGVDWDSWIDILGNKALGISVVSLCIVLCVVGEGEGSFGITDVKFFRIFVDVSCGSTDDAWGNKRKV